MGDCCSVFCCLCRIVPEKGIFEEYFSLLAAAFWKERSLLLYRPALSLLYLLQLQIVAFLNEYVLETSETLTISKVTEGNCEFKKNNISVQ